MRIVFRNCTYLLNTSKGKGIPVHAWTDPDGSRSLRLSDFKTVGT